MAQTPHKVLLAPKITLTKAPKNPYKNIEDTCKAAGFYRGGEMQKQGLWEDVINGKVRPGIKVNSSDIASCRDQLAKLSKIPKSPS